MKGAEKFVKKICMWRFSVTRPLLVTPRWEFVVHTNSTKVVHTNSTKVLSLFYHRSGIIFVALVAKPRVATQYHFNEKPHTIADDMVSHHVITLFFVLLATRSIQKPVPSVGWYILPPKWQKRW